jgi:hypothetical protein
MSFADILNKLAEKKALQGDSDFAYRLISASEKEEEKEAEMIKRGKDRKKLAFSDESWLNSWLKARKDLFMELIPKFMEEGLGKYEAEMAAEQYLEKHPHLVDEKAAILDEGRWDQGIMMADDIYASSLSKMIKKYAGDYFDVTSEEVYGPMMPEKSIPLDGPDEFYEECRFVDTLVGSMLIIEVDSTRFEPGTKFRCSEII